VPDRSMGSIDEKAFQAIFEESNDNHSDSMKAVRATAAEMAELGAARKAAGGHDPDEARDFATKRRELLRTGVFSKGLMAATGIGAALLALDQTPAFAASSADVQMMNTAAGIEVLAVSTYTTALTLPYIGGSSANPVVKAFATTTKQQHADHLKAFNGIIANLGGTAVSKPLASLQPTVKSAVNKIVATTNTVSAIEMVVALALELEMGAAETYSNDASMLTDANAKNAVASVMGVEAQHAAILSAVQALVKGGLASQIKLPPDPTKLPAAAGSVGFPNSFYPTSNAIKG
jgi:hypothetical protein